MADRYGGHDALFTLKAFLAAMLAYSLAAALHLAGQLPGTWLLAALLPLIAYAGVCRHLFAGDPHAYASPASRC